MMRVRYFLIYLLILFSSVGTLEAAYKLIDGKLLDDEEVATLPLEDHYALGVEALESENWSEAVRHFRVMVSSFGNSSRLGETRYYLGASYYHLDEFDLANDAFSDYLQQSGAAKYFQEVLKYKFAIAEQFRGGANKHLFGSQKLPKWVSAEEDALKIYEEIIVAVPGDSLATEAMFGKAQLFELMQEYHDAADTYQSLTQRYPKHSLANDAYRALGNIYLQESSVEQNNIDLLLLAKLNLNKFKTTYPNDPKVSELETNLKDMEEIFAGGLYKTAQFYERKNEEKASVIYYFSAIRQYPKTEVAERCKQRLNALKEYVQEMNISEELIQ